MGCTLVPLGGGSPPNYACTGTPQACSATTNSALCQSPVLRPGCDWVHVSCEGTREACDTYETEEDCEDQAGCSWAG